MSARICALSSSRRWKRICTRRCRVERTVTMRGDGRVFQRGNRWWIAYYAPQNGRSVEHREPGGKTEAEARRLLRQRLCEVAVHQTGLRPFQGPRQERMT